MVAHFLTWSGPFFSLGQNWQLEKVAKIFSKFWVIFCLNLTTIYTAHLVTLDRDEYRSKSEVDFFETTSSQRGAQEFLSAEMAEEHFRISSTQLFVEASRCAQLTNPGFVFVNHHTFIKTTFAPI